MNRTPVLAGAGVEPGPFAVITTGRLEERIWRRFGAEGPEIGISRASPAGTVAAVDHALQQGISGILSFGVAAGLAPAAEPGRLVVADAVALPDGRSRPTDPVWRSELLGALEARGVEHLVARLAGAETIPGHRVDRAKRFRASFAAAVDTESHLVAEAAHVRGLPFMALRVVIDEAADPCLGTDILSVTAAGRWRRGVGTGLLRPWQVARIVRAARQLEHGLQVLARALPAIAGPPSLAISF